MRTPPIDEIHSDRNSFYQNTTSITRGVVYDPMSQALTTGSQFHTGIVRVSRAASAGSEVAFWRMWWVEALAALLSIGGVLISVLQAFHPAAWQASASDLKTLYASAACFRQHLDPYSFANISAIFDANHVVQPAQWYGHAPVYPPFTLAVLAPLTLVPMVPAIYLWVGISALALATVAFTLAVYGGKMFDLSRPWRLLLIALFAALPLLSFALEMGNVSVIAGALCLLAVTNQNTTSKATLLSILAIGTGVLLKPHIAVWVIAALLISRSRRERTLALGAIAVTAASVAGVVLWMAAHHQLFPQLMSYSAVMHKELGAGSMGPNNYELLDVSAQITSVGSLLGYSMHGLTLTAWTAGLLLMLLAALVSTTFQLSRKGSATRLLRVSAWCIFGLLATYHRALDATVVLVVLPYAVARLRRNARDFFFWTYAALLTLMGVGTTPETAHWLAAKPGLYHFATFMLYRQAPLAALLLLCVLIAEIRRSSFTARSVEVKRAEVRAWAIAA